MSIRYAHLTPGLGGTHPAVLDRGMHDILIVALTVLVPLAIGLGITVAYPNPNPFLVVGGIIGVAGVTALLLSTRYEVTLTVLFLYLGLLDGPIKLLAKS